METATTAPEWDGLLLTHWTELFQRLGERSSQYLNAARRKAALHGIVDQAALARYVNVCCALGPNFEDKADNEWALAVLSDDRLETWVKLHQLTVGCAALLERRQSDGSLAAPRFRAADAALLDYFDAQRQNARRDADGLPRVACDLDVMDVRLLEFDWRSEYRWVQGEWQMVGVTPESTAIRFGPGQPVPAQISVLSHAGSPDPLVRLQVRLLMHAQCDQDRHPVLTFAGSHGLSQWRGHMARSVSWYVACAPSVVPAHGLGVAMMEEAVPNTAMLRVSHCGLRDEGVPTGPIQTYIWVYAADQFLLAVDRQAAVELCWPLDSARTRNSELSATRVRLERDGLKLKSDAWNAGFQADLDRALIDGLDKLFTAWQITSKNARMRVTPGIVTGRAALTWGWREGAQGLSAPAYMRVAGEFALTHAMNLELTGEIELAGTRTLVRLSLIGECPNSRSFERESAPSTLHEVLSALVARWEWKFHLAFDPVAVDDAAMWHSAGPCTGAISGEFGLRPRLAGGGGWQWYSRMKLDPVSLPLCVHDALLGQTHSTIELLPALALLDWSLG